MDSGSIDLGGTCRPPDYKREGAEPEKPNDLLFRTSGCTISHALWTGPNRSRRNGWPRLSARSGLPYREPEAAAAQRRNRTRHITCDLKVLYMQFFQPVLERRGERHPCH